MDHLVMATEDRRRTRGDLFKKLKRTRGCIKKLKRLENELSTYMASPEVLMLPGWKQSEGAAILRVVQTTLRHLGPRAFANVDQLIENVDQLIENATKMSLWLKRMISSYNLHYSSYT